MEGREWQCIQCGVVLGHIVGSELSPEQGVTVITSGPNLRVTCPDCGAAKIFYTSDPIVRAMYQLVDAVSGALAKRVINQLSEGTLHKD